MNGKINSIKNNSNKKVYKFYSIINNSIKFVIQLNTIIYGNSSSNEKRAFQSRD